MFFYVHKKDPFRAEPELPFHYNNSSEKSKAGKSFFQQCIKAQAAAGLEVAVLIRKCRDGFCA